jgi:hypothetical protein
MSGMTAASIVAFFNKRGTCEQWIKEGNGAIRHSTAPTTRRGLVSFRPDR